MNSHKNAAVAPRLLLFCKCPFSMLWRLALRSSSSATTIKSSQSTAVKTVFIMFYFFSSVLYQPFVIFDMKHGDSMNVARMSANEMEQMFDHLIGTTCRRLASAIGRIILKRLRCVWHSIRLKMIQVVRLLADHFDARCTKT